MRYFRKWSTQRRRPPPTAQELAAQFVIDLQPRAPVWVDPDDIPEEGDFPAHVVVSAKDCAPVKTKGVASIFAFAQSQFCAELAARQVIAEVMYGVTGDDERPAPARLPACRKIIREGGTTRHIAMREQETEEWMERERVRRAKQRPPRPQKQKFKMKGTRTWADA